MRWDYLNEKRSPMEHLCLNVCFTVGAGASQDLEGAALLEEGFGLLPCYFFYFELQLKICASTQLSAPGTMASACVMLPSRDGSMILVSL